MSPREDPATGRIRVLYVGDAIWGPKPGMLLASDPKIDPTLVPVITVWYTPEEIARYMRLYMPRNYEDLVNNKDLILLGDCDASVIGPRWQSGFTRAVTEAGLGLLMTGGHRGFGGGHLQKGQWKGTMIEREVLPVSVFTQQFVNGAIKMRVLVRDNPLMKSLPWRTAPVLLGLNKLTMKEGAIMLADDGLRAGDPVFGYWDIGAGRSTIFSGDIHGGYDTTAKWLTDWMYWPDFILNLVYYSADVAVPQDPTLMHLLRAEFRTYKARVALLGDLMSFIGKFGANPDVIERGLSPIKEAKREADSLYMQQKYPDALKKLQHIMDSLDALQLRAVKMRNRALSWIYMIEWLVVSGTSIIIGVILWTLMIRRRLYHEIGTTRGG